jgi:opacity protein-like surface antigen
MTGHSALSATGDLSMLYKLASITLAALTATSAAMPALAQDRPTTGVYGVARAGISLDTNARFPDADTRGPSTAQRDTDFKRGFNGEIGIGYDTGPFRVEATAGYATAKLDEKRATTGGFTADGRAKALTFGAAGYLDIGVSERFVPYVGGGIGASRVDGRFSRVSGTPATGSRFSDKDWGLNWHLDAGVGIAASPSTTIELGGRYSRTTKLAFKGTSGTVADTFSPRLSSWSAMLGIRQVF